VVVEGPPLWMCIVSPVSTWVPTVVPEEKRPAFFKDHFTKRIQLGLDLQGGLHLVYEVNIDKACRARWTVCRMTSRTPSREVADVTWAAKGATTSLCLSRIRRPGRRGRRTAQALRRELDEVNRDASAASCGWLRP